MVKMRWCKDVMIFVDTSEASASAAEGCLLLRRSEAGGGLAEVIGRRAESRLLRLDAAEGGCVTSPENAAACVLILSGRRGGGYVYERGQESGVGREGRKERREREERKRRREGRREKGERREKREKRRKYLILVFNHGSIDRGWDDGRWKGDTDRLM
jgi:hypothetical protein